MPRTFHVLLLGSILLLLSALFLKMSVPMSDAAMAGQIPKLTRKQLDESFRNLPLYFEAASDSEHSEFLAHGNGYEMKLSGNNAVLSFTADQTKSDDSVASSPSLLVATLSGSKPRPAGVAEDELTGKVNYLIGNDQSKWRTDVPTYGKVRFQEVYPGVDLLYYGDQSDLEFDFEVAPQADAHAIKLELKGASKLATTDSGDLQISLPSGEITLHKPFIYQTGTNGGREKVDGEFAILGPESFGFKTGEYDRSRKLVIDPVLTYSTLLPGANYGYDVAVDNDGNAVVTGYSSGGVPTTTGMNNGSVFVTKFNPQGSNLIFSSRIGSGFSDQAQALKIDPSNNIVVVGTTSGGSFPAVNPVKGRSTVFVSSDAGDHWANSGNLQEYQTFQITPSQQDPNLIYAAAANKIYRSSNGGSSWANITNNLPVAQEYRLISVNPSNSMELMTANPSGLYRSTDGGNSWSQLSGAVLPGTGVSAIEYDPTNPQTIYLADGTAVRKSTNGGQTWSTLNSGFPSNISLSALVLDPQNTSVLYAGSQSQGVFKSTDSGATWTAINTGITGDNSNIVRKLAIDPSNSSNVYVATGNYASSNLVFKSVNGGGNWSRIYTSVGVSSDIGAISVSRTNSSRLYIGIVGGTGGFFRSDDGGATWNRAQSGMTYGTVACIVESSFTPGKLFVGTGQDSSNNDAFVFKLNPSGDGFVYSTPLGGSDYEYGYALAVDSAGNAYVGGTTRSFNFPVVNGFQTRHSSDGQQPPAVEDGFVTKIAPGGNTIVYSTYLGGNSLDRVNALAVNSQGEVAATGMTQSTNFPLVNAVQTTLRGSDVFVTKISPTGNAIQFSTLWGSTSADNGYAIEYDQSSNLIVVGDVSGSGLPLVNPLDGNFRGSLDGFITIFGPDRGQVLMSSYWGGRDSDSIRDVDLDAAGNIYLGGFSNSMDFPQVRSIKSHSGYFRSSDSAASWSNFNNNLFKSPGDIAFHPTDPNVMFTVTADSVMKTTDGGDSWSPVPSVPPAQTYNSIEISPADPNTMYLAYKDPAGSNPVRLAKSIDGGATWVGLSQFPSVSDAVYKIVVCATNPQIIYAGSFFSIYKSTDAGATWQRMVPFDIWPVQDFAVSPTNPSVLFFAEQYSNGGIHRSTDGGVTWQRMANGITGQYGVYVVIDQQQPSTVYARTQDGVFKSVNGGDSWSPIQIPQVSGKMVADPFSANSLYLQGAQTFSNSIPGVFRSTDGGATWTFSNQGFYSLGGCGTIEPDTRTRGMLHANCSGYGANDIFVSKLDPTGSNIIYSTLFGGNYNPNGSGDQLPFGLAVTPGGSAFVTGGSAMTDFPTTPNAYYRTVNFTSLFLSRLDPSWSIKGRVSDGQSGAPVGGVVVSTSGTVNLNASSDGLGKYSFPNIRENAGVTFTPRKLGYDFTPPNYTVDPLVQDQTLDFTANYITYTIQGTVTFNQAPLANVAVNISGSQTGTTTTDAQGNFSFTVPKHGDYSIRPVLSGYIFGPRQTSFTDVSANLRSDFTARAGYSISGQITRNGNPVVGASVNLGGTETQTTQTDAQGRYLFDAGSNGDYQVTPVMDGLGFLPSSRSFASLSADQTGDFTAFRLPSVIDHITYAAPASQSDNSTRIYTIDDEGYDQHRLTSANATEGQPAWSPNGRKLAYVNNSGSTGQLFVVDANGSNSRMIVGGNGTIYAGSPDWSPDGRKIVFSGYDPSIGTNIYTVNPDGTGLKRISNSTSPSYNPAWSPDGTKIAFSRSGKIYTIDPDGGNAHTIINSTLSEDDPDWSPNGAQIVFTGSIGSTPRIYIVNADGTNLHRLTSEDVFMETSPSWSLSGERIAYIRNSNWANVYTIKADGTDLRQITNTQSSNYTPTWKPKTVTSSPADFDGDGKTDLSVFRPNAAAEWWYQRSSDLQVPATQFGLSSDIPVAADFTGDGKTDVAFYRPPTGQWFILRSEDSSYLAFPFGANGDIPMPADYDGDGRADPAVFRPSAGTWFISYSSDGTTQITQFGAAGDLPVAADYDGDGKADLAVYRLNNGVEEWWLQRSTTGLFATAFGAAGDKAVPGDYTGDGRADVAIWRPETGQWFILRSEDMTYLSFPFGAAGDQPAPGDYDGDGKFDPAVFRPSSATWYVNRTNGSGPLIANFGATNDLPIPSEFVR